MTKKLLTLCLAAGLCLCAPRAAAQDFRSLPVLKTWDAGTHGVLERPTGVQFRLAREIPVLRGEAFVGMFTVYHVGTVNVWGVFASHDPAAQLQPADQLIVPRADLMAPYAVPEISVDSANILYGVPGGYTMWCLLDRGEADGLKPQMRGTAWRGSQNVGDYYVFYAGIHRSYGLLSWSKTGPAPFKEIVIKFK